MNEKHSNNYFHLQIQCISVGGDKYFFVLEQTSLETFFSFFFYL